MPDDDFGCPELWDEYQWERFLQQQDRKTEQYFSLFEQYSNHPDRDEIIAREMGWSFAGDEEADDEAWEEEEFDAGEIGAELDAQEDFGEEDDGEFDDDLDHLQRSEVYLQSLELNRRVFALVEERGDLKEHPVAADLAARTAICGAKLAAALSGDDFSEVGMTIAYLKRSLKAANDSLSAAAELRGSGLISRDDERSITELLFPIRERLVDMMGEFRIELRRRRGEM